MDADDRRKAYDQDWLNFRYQDGLRWSKVQTVALIEGAYLAALYTQNLDPARGLTLSMCASLLVFLICLLSVKDGKDAHAHLKRAELLSDEMGIPPFKDFRATPVMGMYGRHMIMLAIVLVNLFNVLVVFDWAIRVVCQR